MIAGNYADIHEKILEVLLILCCSCATVEGRNPTSTLYQGENNLIMSSLTIAVQSSASTVGKFLQTSKISTATVRTPLWMLGQGASIHIPNDEIEAEDKDLCFVQCDSQQDYDSLVDKLDSCGFDLPKVKVSLEDDVVFSDEDKDIEDVLRETELNEETSNYHRVLDFWNRIHDNTIYGGGVGISNSVMDIEITEDDDEETAEEKLEEVAQAIEEIGKSVSMVTKRESLSILPEMLPTWSPSSVVFFIPDDEMLGDDIDMPAVASKFHTVDIDAKATVLGYDSDEDSVVGVDVHLHPYGEYVVSDNTLIASAIEGAVPGYAIVAVEDEENKDKIKASMWRISHNWVEGLSADRIKGSKEKEILEEFIAEYFSDEDEDEDAGRTLTLEIHSSKDILFSGFPFVKQADIPKDILVDILGALNGKG